MKHLRIFLGILLLFVLIIGGGTAQARSYRTRASDVYVGGYTRKNGTYVRPHYRSAPDGIIWNNYSCIDDGRCGNSYSGNNNNTSTSFSRNSNSSKTSKTINNSVDNHSESFSTKSNIFYALEKKYPYAEEKQTAYYWQLKGNKFTTIDMFSDTTLAVSKNFPAIFRFKTDTTMLCNIGVHYIKFDTIHSVEGTKYVKNHQFIVRNGGDEAQNYKLVYECKDNEDNVFYSPKWIQW